MASLMKSPFKEEIMYILPKLARKKNGKKHEAIYCMQYYPFLSSLQILSFLMIYKFTDYFAISNLMLNPLAAFLFQLVNFLALGFPFKKSCLNCCWDSLLPPKTSSILSFKSLNYVHLLCKFKLAPLKSSSA